MGPIKISMPGLPVNAGWISAFVMLAVLLGLIVAVFPWWFAIGVVLIPFVFFASVSMPHVGLVFTLFLIFEVVPSAFQPGVPFGGGQLKLYDILIMYLSGVVLLRAMAQKLAVRPLIGSYWWPLVFLFCCVGVSLFYVQFVAHNRLVLGEARNFIGWLIVPLIVLGIDTQSRYRIFVREILFIATVIAVFVTIQSLFDLRIMTGARVEALDANQNSDVTRSIAGGGTYLMIFALYFAINRIADGKYSTLWAVPFALLMGAGLAVSFGRGVWIATGIGLLASALLHRGAKSAFVTAVLGAVSIGIVLAGLAAIKPRIAEAVVSRAAGVSEEVGSGGSFNWRKTENAEALKNIAAKPLFGVGIGGEYKHVSSSVASFEIETRYIHNGYLYFPLKMGWMAAFVPILLIVGFVSGLKKCLARPGNQDRGFLAATGASFLVPVITCFTQPEWSTMQSIAALAVLMAMTLLYLRFGSFADGDRRA
jgi:hypothetical protein